jgi:hypothetical protein
MLYFERIETENCISISSFLGSTAQLRPWPPPQNPAEFLGGFSTIFFTRPTSILEEQASVFISLRGRVATHFSRLLRHAWVTVGLFLFPGHHTGMYWHLVMLIEYWWQYSVCFFNWASRHEGVLGEWRYSFTHSLTSALDTGVWSASRLGRFTPWERAPGTYWIGGLVGLRAVLNAVMKRKILSPRRESKSRTPIVQPVAQRYSACVVGLDCIETLS